MARLLVPVVLWAIAAAAQSNDSVFDVCSPPLYRFSLDDIIYPLLVIVPRVPSGWDARPQRNSSKLGGSASLQRVRGPWTGQRRDSL